MQTPANSCSTVRACSRTLNFRSAPDYESPMGGANDDSNTYMVTVKAEADGEMEMVEVTVMVTNVNEAGTVTLIDHVPGGWQ